MARLILLIIDGLGCGAQEDSAFYGDAHANTLKHVVDIGKADVPHLQSLGLANIIPLDHLASVEHPAAAFGKIRELSAGKDSTTGHWEFAGIVLEQAFPTYAEGFPDEVIHTLTKATGKHRFLCNKPYSGSQVILDYGDEHLATGDPILYTSADSVLQIAAHTDVVPLHQLYEWCTSIRKELETGPHAVGRVIARPFSGISGQYVRVSEKRKDYSLKPPKPNVMSVLRENGVQVHSIGKVVDLFDGEDIDQYQKTENNADGLRHLLNWLTTTDSSQNLFQFVNLIDTDQLFGHRNDILGYARSLEEIDRAIPDLLAKMNQDDLLIITGDHGNDPSTPGTDHSREFVPLIVWPTQRVKKTNLGTLDGFSSIAESIKAFFGLEHKDEQSFLD
jgi:phosphopentomutase